MLKFQPLPPLISPAYEPLSATPGQGATPNPLPAAHFFRPCGSVAACSLGCPFKAWGGRLPWGPPVSLILCLMAASSSSTAVWDDSSRAANCFL